MREVYAKLDNVEELEAKDLALRIKGIEALMERLLKEQGIYEQKAEEWFQRVRKNHNIPVDANIMINEDFEIVAAEDLLEELQEE